MADIGYKLEKIRGILGNTVIFKVGMKEAGKYDILSIDICEEEQKQASYIG